MTTNPCHPNATAVDVKDHVIPHGAIHGAVSCQVSTTPEMKEACFLPEGTEKSCKAGEAFFVKHGDQWHMAHFPEDGKLVGPMIFGPGKASRFGLMVIASNGSANAIAGLSMVLATAVFGLWLAYYLHWSGAAYGFIALVSLSLLAAFRKSMLAHFFDGKHVNAYLKTYADLRLKHVHLPDSAHSLLKA